MFFVNLDYEMSKIYSNPVRSTGHMLVMLTRYVTEEKSSRKFRNSRVRPSTLPPVHLVQIPRDNDTITPGRCFTVLDSSLPPAIMKLFISCTNPSSNLDPHVSQGEVQAIPPKPELGSFLRVSTQLHMGPAFTSHMVDIYATQIALEERMRETGWQQEAIVLGSRVSRRSRVITSGKLSATLRNSHTAVILIKASKVKEMYTGEISKGNASYLS